MALDIWHYPRRDFAYATFTTLVSGPVPALTLFGPRRTGKTQFLQYDLGYLAAETYGHRVVYASFWQTAAAPLSVLLYECDRALQPKGYAERLADWATSLPVKAKLSALKGAAAVEIDLGRGTVPAPSEGLLLLDAVLDRLADAKKPALLLLDEFQEIALHPQGSEIMAGLRTSLDKRKLSLRTVFTGSSQIGLDKVFSAREAPFYRFAAPLTLPEFEEGFVDHQLDVFRKTYRRTIDRGEALRFFERFNRNPMFFQRWLITLGLHPGLSEAEASARTVQDLARQLDFDRNWRELTTAQRAVARLVAERTEGLFGEAAAPRLAELSGGTAPSPQARQTAMRLLARRGIVDKLAAEWRITDPLFERWILDRGADEF